MKDLPSTASEKLDKAGIAPGDRIVVAVSGGPDSVALLLLMDAYAKTRDCSLIVCHVDHLIRQNSALDAAFTYQLSHKLGWPCAVISVDALGLAGDTGMSLEQAARNLRHRALGSVARSSQVSLIALGHTLNDRAETILLNIIRGTGPKGLHGMGYRKSKIIRPLLEFTRDDVLELLKAYGQDYRIDETNADLDFDRNMVRLKLMPYIEGQMDVRIDANLNNLAKIMEEEDSFLDELANDIYTRMSRVTEAGVIINRVSLMGERLPMIRRVLRLAVGEISGHLMDISFVHIEQIILNLAKTSGVFTLTGGITAVFEYDNLIIGRARDLAPSSFTTKTLKVPGQVTLSELGVKIRASSARDLVRPCQAREAYIDADRIGPTLSVRGRRLGDRFVPVGMSGSKKLQDYFIDQKVPLRRRDEIPIVESRDEIVWVAGMRVDSRFAATPDSRRIIRLDIENFSLVD